MREAEYKILVVDDEPEIEAMVRQRVHRDIRSVIISAYGDMSDIRIAMNRGAFDFVDAAPDNSVSSFADGAAQSDDITYLTLRRS
ncbi:MAG: hypothetical protein OXH22_14475 [Chloroflexi bacterium]|nr:hypothetical protein [Chloroflexota bacterium]